MTTPFLRSFRLKHFKAVRDSGVIRFSPLTVFIGNNGSGKSSITEALETLQAIVDQGLDRGRPPMQQARSPKTRLTKLFQQHRGQPYTDRFHAKKIVNAMPDLSRVKRCASFVRFAVKATGVTP